MVADYDTEAEALAEVQTYMTAHGREAVSDWALARNGERRRIMIYELYDWDDANLIAAYHNEADALTKVAAQVRAYGRASVTTWTLLISTPDGMRKDNIAADDALADLALRVSAGTASVDMPGTMRIDDL